MISQQQLAEKADRLHNTIRIFKLEQSKPNSAGGVDVFIGFTNKSDKTIKYITFTVTPYNAVGDITYSEIGNESTKNLRATGPYNKGEGLSGTYSHYWQCIWYTWDISLIKLTGINIEYTDGTTENISAIDVNSVLY